MCFYYISPVSSARFRRNDLLPVWLRVVAAREATEQPDEPAKIRHMHRIDPAILAAWVGAFGTWVAAGAAILTAAVAVVAIIFAWRQLKEASAARELTKQLDVARSQPYVVFYAEPSSVSNVIMDLVLKNFGLTAARNVRVSIDPWPERSAQGGEPVEIPKVFPLLAPGQEWRVLWDTGVTRTNSNLPDIHLGSVFYTGLLDEELSTPINIDLGIYKRRTLVVKTEHHAAIALEEIQKTLKHFSEDTIEPGIRAWARDGAVRDQERIDQLGEVVMEMEEERRKAADRSAG